MKTINKVKLFVLLVMLLIPTANMMGQNNRNNNLTLAEKVELVNASCPIEVEDGIIMTKMRLERKLLVMECKLDPTSFNGLVSAIKSDKNSVRRSLVQGLNNDDTFRPILDECRRNGKDAAFWFKSTGSGKVIKMNFKLKKR